MPARRPSNKIAPTRNVRGQATRAQVLDAAGAIFARKGYEGASLRVIAEASGAGLSSIMYHFGSKKGLFLETIRHFIVDNARLDSHFEELWTVDASDPQAVADALRHAVGSFLGACFGPGRTEHVTGLYVRIIVDGDADALSMLLQCFEGIQRKLPELIRRVRADLTQRDVDFWKQLFWSQLQYTVVGQDLVLYDMQLGEHFTQEYLDEAAWRFTWHCCLPLGLPAPQR